MSVHAWGEGHVIAGRYQLQSPLGEGGMGAVWRALHLSLRSPVAVKLLNPAIANDPEILERFLREAQSAAALRGAHVVQIFDYGVEDGTPYIAMEMLSGESLADRIEKGRPFSIAELATIFNQVGKAVSKAHEVGIIHRDLKPDNIFLVREGDDEIAKVLDFGIAKIAEGSLTGSSGRGTRTGAMLGTPYYMSPEQAQGNKAVDHRSDLWALSVIAYECVTKRRPFISDALGDLVIQICMREPPPPSQVARVPAGFDQWFLRGCSKDPNSRFQTARELVETLSACLLGAPGQVSMRSAGALDHGSLDRTSPHSMLTTNSAAAASVPILSQAHPRSANANRVALLATLAVAVLVLGGGALLWGLSSNQVEVVREQSPPQAPTTQAPTTAAKPPTNPVPLNPSLPAPSVLASERSKPVALPPVSAATSPQPRRTPSKRAVAARSPSPKSTVAPTAAQPQVKPVPPADNDLFSGRK